jgi:hypothetical protein
MQFNGRGPTTAAHQWIACSERTAARSAVPQQCHRGSPSASPSRLGRPSGHPWLGVPGAAICGPRSTTVVVFPPSVTVGFLSETRRWLSSGESPLGSVPSSAISHTQRSPRAGIRPGRLPDRGRVHAAACITDRPLLGRHRPRYLSSCRRRRGALYCPRAVASARPRASGTRPSGLRRSGSSRACYLLPPLAIGSPSSSVDLEPGSQCPGVHPRPPSQHLRPDPSDR